MRAAWRVSMALLCAAAAALAPLGCERQTAPGQSGTADMTRAPNSPEAELFGVRREFSSGSLKLELALSSTELSVADRLVVQARVTAPAGAEPVWPKAWSGMEGEGFSIVGASEAPARVETNGDVAHERELILEPFLAGTHTIPAMRFTLARAAGDAAQPPVITTDAIRIEARSSLDQPPTEAGTPGGGFPTLAGSEASPLGLPSPPAFWLARPAYYVPMASLLALGLAGLGWYAAAHRRARPVDHAARALARLGEARSLLNGDGNDARSRTQAADRLDSILRDYLEDHLRIRARALSTPELLKSLAEPCQASRWSLHSGSRLRQCFSAFDSMRYAPSGFDSSAPSLAHFADELEEFVRETAPQSARQGLTAVSTAASGLSTANQPEREAAA